jgi:ribonuclease D
MLATPENFPVPFLTSDLPKLSPPFFILSHDLLVEIAAAAAAHQPIEPLVPRHLPPRRRDGLAQAIKAGLELSADKQPNPLHHTSRRPNEAERRRFGGLERHRNAHAHRLDIDPTLIASRATLMDLARDWDHHAPQLMNWQRELLQP